MSHDQQTTPEPSFPIVLRSDDVEQLERLIAASGRRRDHAGVRALEQELERARVVEPEQMPRDVVAMHSSVRFVDEATGVEEILTLVYPFEADAARGRVSVLAAIGCALLGLRAGQSITWTMPHGAVRRLRVLEVGVTPQD